MSQSRDRGPVNRCPMSTHLGAYVLDALEEVERQKLAEHLRACDTCPAELEALRSLPDLLGRVEPPTALAIDEPVEPRPSLPELISAARKERRVRRRRWLAWSAATCAVVLLGAVALGVGLRESADPAPEIAAPNMSSSATDAVTGVNARAGLTSQAWGTQIRLGVYGLKPPLRCQLVAHAADGRTEVAGAWNAEYRSVDDIVVTTSVPLDDLVSLDVITESGQPLVKIPVRR